MIGRFFQIFSGLFILVQTAHIVAYCVLPVESNPDANPVTPILYIITTIVVLWLINFDRSHGIFSSGLHFTFWMLVLLASLPDLLHYVVTVHQRVGRRWKHTHGEDGNQSRLSQ